MRKRYFLCIELKDVIAESALDYSLLARRHRTHLKALLDAIEQAAQDRRVHAILVIVRQPELGWAQAEELAAALDRFRRAGKSVTVFLGSAGNREYFLATAGDSIYLAPSGSVNLVGLRAETIFLKEGLQWLGIQPQLVRTGQYKTAGDMFTRAEMSEAHQEQTRMLLDDLQAELVERTSQCRRRTGEEVVRWIEGGPYSASEAKQTGLVDDLLFEDQVIHKLEQAGLARRDLARYKVGDGFFKRLLVRRPQVAMVVAEGLIAPGRSWRTGGRHMVCGSETMARFLADARRRKRIRGLVLRINSPGGSALASDAVWREVRLTAEKKPVVVSMGDVAASGGYYIATAARKILSRRATITGSIGVIGGKMVVRELLEKLRLRVDSVSGAGHAGFQSSLQPYSFEERTLLARHMEEFYRGHFVPKVMEGRGKSENEVLQLAQGRVWSGRTAHSNGLVDAIGGIREAVEEVKSLCRLAPARRIRLVVYARRPSLREMLVPGFGPTAWMETLADLTQILQEEILALWPFETRIR